MWCILHMTVKSLVAVVATRRGKIIKNGLHIFERGENLLQNGIFHFVHISGQDSFISLFIS